MDLPIAAHARGREFARVEGLRVENLGVKKVIAIVGPHASGKSHYAVELAVLLGGEIISADSRQVYRGLDLGTGKITREEMRGVPHHLIDIIDPGERYSLFDFQRDARLAIDAIHDRKRLPILVGGTGLYVDAVIEGYRLVDAKPDPILRSELEGLSADALTEMIRREQPDALAYIENRNKRRLIRAIEIIRAGFDYKETRKKSGRPDSFSIGIKWERERLLERIRERLRERLEKGMIEEVERLRASGVPDRFLFDIGLEYRAILNYLRGGYPSRRDLVESLEIAVRQFARRQMTWFNKRPGITWIDGADSRSSRVMEDIRSFVGLPQRGNPTK